MESWIWYLFFAKKNRSCQHLWKWKNPLPILRMKIFGILTSIYIYVQIRKVFSLSRSRRVCFVLLQKGWHFCEWKSFQKMVTPVILGLAVMSCGLFSEVSLLASLANDDRISLENEDAMEKKGRKKWKKKRNKKEGKKERRDEQIKKN